MAAGDVLHRGIAETAEPVWVGDCHLVHLVIAFAVQRDGGRDIVLVAVILRLAGIPRVCRRPAVHVGRDVPRR